MAASRKRARWQWPVWIGFLTMVGLALRVWHAWCLRYSANGDFGIVALMARHMAEGIDYPVFSYGVAYMGGLEPILSALMKGVLRSDTTAFAVNLGTALPGALLPPLVYLMGRDAGTRRTGLIAMLYCLVGSDALFHYSVAPRGGYMTMMVGGLFALWMTCRVVTQENRGGKASRWSYFLIGFAAGLGWWATQLVTVFLVSAVVILLPGWRWRIVWRGSIPGLSGFVLGSLPWWIWNASHQWASWDFGSSLGKVRFTKGLESFGTLFLALVEMRADTVIGVVRLALLIGLVAGALVLLVHERRRKVNKQAWSFRLAVPVLILSMVLFYCTSHFVRANACRYLLPLVPALAVAIGLSCDALLTRFRMPWGWAILLAVMPTQVFLLGHLGEGVAADAARWNTARQLEQSCAPACGGVFLGEYYASHWLNYASGERICVAALPVERYTPYARKAELAEQPAYLDNYADVQSFITGTAAQCSQTRVGGLAVTYGLTAPTEAWTYVEASDMGEARDHTASNGLDVLLDSALHTSWNGVLLSHARTNIMFSFKRPVACCGLRLISYDDRYPAAVSVEGRSRAGAEWVPLMNRTEATRYFWSGPHVKLDGMQYFQEFRFPALPDGIGEIRVTFENPGESESAISLSEILFLESAPVPTESRPPVDQVVGALRRNQVRQLYAPRWLADRIACDTTNEMVISLPSVMMRKIDELPLHDKTQPVLMTFSSRTGLILDRRDAPRSRAVLNQAGCRWREISMGSMILFVVAEDGQGVPASRRDHVYWTELGCFAANQYKARAQTLFEAAVSGRGGSGSTLDELRGAVRLYPPHYPARQALIKRLKAEGLEAEAAPHEAILKATTQPALPASVRFSNGVHFLGLTMGTGGGQQVEAVRGRDLPVTYYWKCPPDFDAIRWAVFVHMVKGRSRLQDDHVFLLSIPPDRLMHPLFEEIYAESRVLAIPPDLPPGEYRIELGLVDRITNRRVAYHTDRPSRHNAAILPGSLTVR